MALECREIVDSLKETPKVDKCHECEDLQRQFAENPGRKSMNRTGLVIAAITGGSALGLSAICLPFVTPALRRVCLPYVPATTTQIANIQTALKRHGHKNGSKRLVDIGSGDGRIVHTVAQNGYIAHGIELNPWLVLFSKVKSLQLGLRGKATFSRQDLWKANLGQYDNVVIFGVEQMMAELETKLGKEMKPECTVIACRFPFPKWNEIATIGDGIDSVWIYKPAVVAETAAIK